MVMGINGSIGRYTPSRFKIFIEKRFKGNDQAAVNKNHHKDEAPAFDMIRASVNLVVASALIALGTSLKLPLSTTYVTFMVAMGTSLSDRAWGRESAVYRVTGVFTVIGGWFMTALTAFLISAIFAILLMITNWVGMVILVILAIFMLIRTRIMFKKREAKEELSDDFLGGTPSISRKETFEKTTSEIHKSFLELPILLDKVFTGLFEENIRKLRKTDGEISTYYNDIKRLKDNVPLLLDKLSEENIEAGHYYIQIIDYLKQIANSVLHIGRPTFDHINNQHKGTSEEQHKDLTEIQTMLRNYLSRINENMANDYAEGIDLLSKQQGELLALIDKQKKRQIKRIKNSESGTKVSMLYLNTLDELKNIILLLLHIAKSHRDFVNYQQILKKN
jgi:Na+/phosphate symporter